MKPDTQLPTASCLTPERIQSYLRARGNPLRNLTPEALGLTLDAWRNGYLAEPSLVFEAILDRDDILKSVAPKRCKSVARHGYSILACANAPAAEAERHQNALEEFYGTLHCTNAVELEECGGVSLLIRQMMSAVGVRYAIHQIAWQIQPGRLSAEFRFVPLYFFESTAGRLRFLPAEGASGGIDLVVGSWLVTVGDGLMPASSVAYLFKNLPMKDWVIYCERHGMPGIQGTTSAPKDSPEWEAMVEAVQSVAADFACVTNENEKINLLDFRADGEIPYPALIERMDRALATLWRGADLGTLSRAQSLGSSLQRAETALLEQDDAAWISETLQEKVDRLVIQHHFGHGVEPRAYFRLNVAPGNPARHLAVDRFLLRAGARFSVREMLERYQRPAPRSGERLLSAPGRPAAPAASAANVRRRWASFTHAITRPNPLQP